MSKYVLAVSEKQRELLTDEVLASVLHFAVTYASIVENKRTLLIADENGKPLQRLNLV